MAPDDRHVAVVVNPTKFDDLDEVMATVNAACEKAGRPETRWYETTADDPGEGQTRTALADGAGIVCPLGGDGTVRAVAESLVWASREAGGEDARGTTPIGLLPGGTGNLLARNLELPLALEDALDVVLNGSTRDIDVGVLTCDSSDEEDVFLVMAGMGLDADMMAEANEKVKGVLGWPAYLISGTKALFHRGFGVRIDADSGPVTTQHARMIVVGNCGTLTGGVELMPTAKLDDGTLDAVLMAPKSVVGWAPMLMSRLTRSRRGHPRVRDMTSTCFSIEANRPVQAELDGDAIGECTRMVVKILPGALTVLVPVPVPEDAQLTEAGPTS